MPSLWDCLMLGWLALEILVAVLTRTRHGGGGKVQDRGSMLLLWLSIGGAMWASAWAREALPTVMLQGVNWLKPLALAVLIAGLAIRLVAIFTLGKSFSANVAIRSDQKVQRNGIFAIVRHPSYFGLVLIFVAVGLRTNNLASLAAMLIPTTAALLYRIHVEEAALLQAFGEDYADYARVTKRLIPGIY